MDALMMVEGLKRAGKNLTREKFVDAMEGIHHLDVGLGKGMEAAYTPADHLGFHKVFLGAIKNGSVVAVTDWKEYTSQIKSAER
jgi:branched-chain amino acid transport system substrate-binding protein